MAAEMRAGIQKTQREGTQREGRGDVLEKTPATAPGEVRRRRRPATGEEEAAPVATLASLGCSIREVAPASCKPVEGTGLGWFGRADPSPTLCAKRATGDFWGF